MNALVIFDGDNTLWDTDAVYRSAQIALLHTLGTKFSIDDPASELQTLRRVDQLLAKRLGHFEYEYQRLPIALAYFYSTRSTIEEASNYALRPSIEQTDYELLEIAQDAYEAFKRSLGSIPRLFPDTQPVLAQLSPLRQRNRTVVTLLLSEGRRQRLEHILNEHGMTQFFDEIIITEAKSTQAFRTAKELGLGLFAEAVAGTGPISISVGDSIARDVKFANQIGCVTVYIPSPFRGIEKPTRADEKPAYEISRLRELIPILRELGVGPLTAKYDTMP